MIPQMFAAVLVLVACGAPGNATTDQSSLVVSEVVPDGVALRLSNTGGHSGSVRVTRNGVIEWRAPGAREPLSTQKLEDGCTAGRSFLVHSAGDRFVLFVPFDCEVQGGALVVVGGKASMRVADRLPFNFIRPLVLHDSIVVVASSFAGRMNWATGEWLWKRELVVAKAQGGGGVEPRGAALKGECVSVIEDDMSAAQYGRKPTELHLRLEDGSLVDAAKCSKPQNPDREKLPKDAVK